MFTMFTVVSSAEAVMARSFGLNRSHGCNSAPADGPSWRFSVKNPFAENDNRLNTRHI
jgi:hypothetical protein